MCEKMNKENISKFSKKDSIAYGEYEHELEQFVKAIDPLLDAAAIDVRCDKQNLATNNSYYRNCFRALKDSSLFEKMKILKQNWHLIKSAKIIGPHAQAFYELMTAPTTKILDKW